MGMNFDMRKAVANFGLTISTPFVVEAWNDQAGITDATKERR